jgi:hypothetical protein
MLEPSRRDIVVRLAGVKTARNVFTGKPPDLELEDQL